MCLSRRGDLMGNMYNEMVTRRKLPVLFKLLIIIVMFIVLSEITKEFKIGTYNLGNVLSIVMII